MIWSASEDSPQHIGIDLKKVPMIFGGFDVLFLSASAGYLTNTYEIVTCHHHIVGYGTECIISDRIIRYTESYAIEHTPTFISSYNIFLFCYPMTADSQSMAVYGIMPHVYTRFDATPDMTSACNDSQD